MDEKWMETMTAKEKFGETISFEKLQEIMPSYMKYETVYGKKEHYNFIVSRLAEAKNEIQKGNFGQMLLYLGALEGTLSNMSIEIYEQYRALEDLFRAVLKDARAIAASQSREERKKLAEIEQTACEMGILLSEKYEDEIRRLADGTDETTVEKREPAEEQIPVKLLVKTARSATFEIADGGIYETKETYNVYLNGTLKGTAATVVTSVFELIPATAYEVQVVKADGTVAGSLSFTTEEEFVTLNVKEFGAVGDGVNDDTRFIQAAILSCPPKSRVLVPAGTYRISSLFLKSGMNLELAEGAELLAFTDRALFPKFPALITSYDETDEYNLGTWEGNPLPMFAGIITGINVKNVTIYGKGTINGNASKETWWKNPKVMNIAFRPRLFFISHCENIMLQGVKFCNSPSWTLHPYFSNELKFYNLAVENPSDSPNTDGLDPESCKNVEIAGVRFSLGDDCIAVKSGKIYMGRKHKTPSENIHIRQCLMENGHGAVTLGSEMAGGVINLLVEECRFSHTDRGLRIKTRRGRGEDAILDRITFRKIKMDHVMTPFCANSFYFCDPDGKTAYVQSREVMPVDERTPAMKRFEFSDIEAKNCHVAASYFEGLPEKKIEEIVMKNVSVSFAENAKSGVPVMSEGVETCSKRGLFARNVTKLVLDHVVIEGQVGEKLELHDIDEKIVED